MYSSSEKDPIPMEPQVDELLPDSVEANIASIIHQLSETLLENYDEGVQDLDHSPDSSIIIDSASPRSPASDFSSIDSLNEFIDDEDISPDSFKPIFNVDDYLSECSVSSHTDTDLSEDTYDCPSPNKRRKLMSKVKTQHTQYNDEDE